VKKNFEFDKAGKKVAADAEKIVSWEEKYSPKQTPEGQVRNSRVDGRGYYRSLWKKGHLRDREKKEGDRARHGSREKAVKLHGSELWRQGKSRVKWQ